MALVEIPVTYKAVCDGCGDEEFLKSKSRPTTWTQLIFERDAVDFHGAAVADATVRRLLCAGCSAFVIKAINDTCDVRRKPAPTSSCPLGG